MPRGRPLTDADTEEVKANMEARQCEKIFNPEDIIGAMNSLFRQREAVADDTWANIERDAGRGNMNPLQVQAIINRSENMYAEHIIELCEFYKSNYACIYDEDLDYDCSAIVPIWPEEDFSTPAFSTATELKREVLGWDSLKNEGYVRDGMNRYYVKLSGGCLMSYDTKIVYEGVVLSSSSQVKVLNGGAFCRVDSITEIK